MSFRLLLTSSFLMLIVVSPVRAEDSKALQSIVVFGASGVIGQAIVAEALGRQYKVTGVSRNPDQFTFRHKNFIAAPGNPTSPTSVAELTQDVDAIIVAVGGRSATDPEKTAMNLTALALTAVLAERGSQGPQVVIIGGGMTMHGSPENMIRNMPPNAKKGSAMYALFLGHWEAYQTYKQSQINWTFLAPPRNILGFRDGANVARRSYRASTSGHLFDADRKNEISMSDLAMAAIDFSESSEYNHAKVTVAY